MKKFTIQLQNENFATNKVTIPLSSINKKIKVVDAFIEMPVASGSGTYSVNFSTVPSSIGWTNVDTINVENGKVIKVNISDELQDSLNAPVDSIILTFNGSNDISFATTGSVNIEYMTLSEYRKNSRSHTIDLKNAGKLSIDLLTRGVHINTPLVSSDNNPLPLSISANYNSESYDKIPKPLGKGWNLNVCQYLVENDVSKDLEQNGETYQNKHPKEKLSFTYIDENGNENILEEKYYYLDDSKQKIYIDRNSIHISADGSLKYTKDEIVNKDVFTELESTNGIKLISNSSDIDKFHFVKSEPEDVSTLRNNVTQLDKEIKTVKHSILTTKQQIAICAISRKFLIKQIESEKNNVDFMTEYNTLLEDIEKIKHIYNKSNRDYIYTENFTMETLHTNNKGAAIQDDHYTTVGVEAKLQNSVEKYLDGKTFDKDSFDGIKNYLINGGKALSLTNGTELSARDMHVLTGILLNESSELLNFGINHDKSTGSVLKLQIESNKSNEKIYCTEYDSNEFDKILKEIPQISKLSSEEDKENFIAKYELQELYSTITNVNKKWTYAEKDIFSIDLQLGELFYQLDNYQDSKHSYEKEKERCEQLIKAYENQLPVHYLLDDKNTVYGFGKSNLANLYRLILISDAYNNTITFNYESTESDKLKNIVTAENKTISFEYDNNLLKSIIDAKDRKVELTYSNHLLSQITHSNGLINKLYYNGDKLCSVLDQSGVGLNIIETGDKTTIQSINIVKEIKDGKILYKDEKPFREFINLSPIELVSESSSKEVISIIHKNYKSTTILDSKNNSVTYLFDKLGNVRTIYENNFDETGENVFVNVSSFEYQNNITSEQLSPLPYSKNYLENSHFKSPSKTQVPLLYLGNDEMCSEHTIPSSFKVCKKTHTIEANADLEHKSDFMIMSEDMLKHINLSYKNCNHKTYMVCGWAKANSAFVLTDEVKNNFADYIQKRKFELRVEITYHDGSKNSEPINKSFDWRNTEWQYCAVPVKIDSSKVVDEIKCFIDYSGNTGELQYTDLEFKEADWECVEYDNFNRPIRKESAHSEWITLFKYDDNTTNVAREILVKSNEENEPTRKEYTTTYEYNKQGSLLRSTDYKGIVKENIYNDKGLMVKSVTYHKDEPSSKLYEEKVLNDKGEITSKVNGLGENTTTYQYIDGCGDISVQTDENGVATAFGYAPDGTLLETATTIDGLENANTYGYTLDYLTKLKHNNFEIKYDYDNQGRTKKIKIADNEYLNKIYIDPKPKETTEADEDCVPKEKQEFTILKTNEAFRQTFNEKGKLLDTYYIEEYEEGKEQEGKLIARNIYDPFGNLVCTKEFSYSQQEDGSDIVNEISHTIGLDKFGNVYKEEITQQENKQQTSFVSIANEYDEEHSKVENTVINIGEKEMFYNYSYSEGPDSQLESILLPSDVEQCIEYDKLGRLSKIENGNLAKTFCYLKKGDHTSNLVSNMRFAINGISNENLHYSYDKKGNITEIRNNNFLVARYQYDGLSRIIREDNRVFDKTSTFSYDAGGNILTKTEYPFTLFENLDHLIGTSVIYSYPVSGWKDQLMSYNFEKFEYDALGNPTTYRDKFLKWSHGRLLDKFADIAEFTYNANGIRTSKKSNGFTTKFYLNGNQILMQRDASNELTFYYGADGITGFHLKNAVVDEDFYYKKNIQNDIIGIYSTQGTQIARYSYDAWGNCITEYLQSDGTYVKLDNDYNVADTSIINRFISYKNPFRYRSYYYDFETNLYYLNSRYYDPELGRFINADNIFTLDASQIVQNGLNLYAYCLNNPVNEVDESGCIIGWIIAIVALITAGAVAGAVVYSVSVVAKGITTGKWEWSWADFLGTVYGTAIAAPFTLIPGIGPYVSAFVGGFFSSFMSDVFNAKMYGKNFNFGLSLIKGVVSGIVSFALAGIFDKIPGLNRISNYMNDLNKAIFNNIGRGLVSLTWRSLGIMFSTSIVNSISDLIFNIRRKKHF